MVVINALRFTCILCVVYLGIKAHGDSDEKEDLQALNEKVMKEMDADDDGKLSPEELEQLGPLLIKELRKPMRRRVVKEFEKTPGLDRHMSVDKVTDDTLQEQKTIIDGVVNESVEAYRRTGELPADIVTKVEHRMNVANEKKAASFRKQRYEHKIRTTKEKYGRKINEL